MALGKFGPISTNIGLTPDQMSKIAHITWGYFLFVPSIDWFNSLNLNLNNYNASHIEYLVGLGEDLIKSHDERYRDKR